jgi:uncharacterized protein (DUF302 family)
MRKLCLALALVASPALAQESTVYDYEGSFDDATFGVESAIVGRGLVVDWVSHVGEMLERTRADIGSDVIIYDNADIYIFCSATLSRKVMEADPANIAHCPYGVFVTDKDGTVQVGYRNQPEGVMQEVQTLLDDIAREAAGK